MRPRRMMAYQYKAVPRDQDDEFTDVEIDFPKRPTPSRTRWIVFAMVGFTLLAIALMGLSYSTSAAPAPESRRCDQVEAGYQCRPEISHFWGQYSPFYSVPSKISADVPKKCKVTFAQALSRHGARDPTESKTRLYRQLVDKIHANVQSYDGEYEFLEDYEYTLGADQLTAFGQQQLVNSGVKFYNRYRNLARTLPPFIRSSDQTRVVESAMNFSRGYYETREKDHGADGDQQYPYPIVTISEDDNANNTLNHALCDAFEASELGDENQVRFRDVFVPPILNRLNSGLPGANLTAGEVILFMDLCPFNTVAAPGGKFSQFCDLFSEEEWHQYDYYQSVGKYYGYSNGNPLGPTQGVGFTNELISRMTGKPVVDRTSVNHTLDDNPETFPIGPSHSIFADFSHDNDMTAIFSAIGLYNSTKPLSLTEVQNTRQTDGYSASWTAPFASRAYFEKMKCDGFREELVRVLVNDRVIPLQTCGGDSLGRCKLSKFIESLSFARAGGHWDDCFV